jgi:hypothetical protein
MRALRVSYLNDYYWRCALPVPTQQSRRHLQPPILPLISFLYIFYHLHLITFLPSHPISSHLSGDDIGEDLVMLPEVKRKLEEGAVLNSIVPRCTVLYCTAQPYDSHAHN